LKSIRKLKKSEKSGLDEMLDVATAKEGLSDSDFSQLTSDSTSRQLKVFLLLLARNELLRVIRLTNALNELEESFLKEALENKEEMGIGSLSGIMKSVVDSLNRSTELIHRVMNDDSIKFIIDNSTNIFNTQQNAVVILDSVASREKVKKIANQFLDVVNREFDKETNSVEGELIPQEEVDDDNE